MRNDKRLKIHVEEEASVETVAQRLHQNLPLANSICEQFEALTGWVVQYDLSESEYKKEIPEDRPLWGHFEITDLSEKVGPGQNAVHRGKSEELLQSFNQLVSQLKESQTSLELGGGGFRYFDFQTTPNKSDSLANQLISVAKSLNGEAAALYLLDDDTTQLRIRACVGGNGKPQQLAATRPLEHSLADLEALVGNVVQINHQDLSPAWNLPEPFENGACITVGSDGMPLGTLWIFFEKESQLNPQEIGMLEAVAQDIGIELVSRKKPDQKQSKVPQLEQEIRNASRINDGRLPHFSPEIDGWKIAGWTYRKDKLTGNFHDWAMTPSGGLSVSVGQVSGPSVSAAINANNLRSLICAHRDYRHNAKKMVEKLNENIWTNSPGDELAGLIYSLVDPETGEVQIVNAGDGGVVLLDGSKTVSVDQFQDPLGLDMESSYIQWEGVLAESQSIVIFSQGLRTAFCELTAAVDDADLFGNIFENCNNEPDLILAAIQDMFYQSDFQIDAPDLSVVVLTRKQPPQGQYYYGKVEESVSAESSRGNLAAGTEEVERSFNAFIEAISVGDVDWVKSPDIDDESKNKNGSTDSKKDQVKEDETDDLTKENQNVEESSAAEVVEESSRPKVEKTPALRKQQITSAPKKRAAKKVVKKASDLAKLKPASKAVAKGKVAKTTSRAKKPSKKAVENKSAGVKKSAKKSTPRKKTATKKTSTTVAKKTTVKRSAVAKKSKKAAKTASTSATKRTPAKRSTTVKKSTVKKTPTKKPVKPKATVKKKVPTKGTASKRTSTDAKTKALRTSTVKNAKKKVVKKTTSRRKKTAKNVKK